MTTAQAKPRLTNAAREALTCYLFLLPWGIGFLAFVIGPVVASFVLGFMDYEIVTPARWVGLANYIELFTDDDRFLMSMGNTLYYVLVFCRSTSLSRHSWPSCSTRGRAGSQCTALSFMCRRSCRSSPAPSSGSGFCSPSGA